MEVFDVYVKASSHLTIEAENREEAEAIVESMSDDELMESYYIDDIEVS